VNSLAYSLQNLTRHRLLCTWKSKREQDKELEGELEKELEEVLEEVLEEMLEEMH
jgi:hypothetical protein